MVANQRLQQGAPDAAFARPASSRGVLQAMGPELGMAQLDVGGDRQLIR